MKRISISEQSTLTLMYELMQHARRKTSEPPMKVEIERHCGNARSPEMLSAVSRASEFIFPAMFVDFLAENPELLNVQELEVWASKRRLLIEPEGRLM